MAQKSVHNSKDTVGRVVDVGHFRNSPVAFAAEILASPVATRPRMVCAHALPSLGTAAFVVAIYPYFVSLRMMPSIPSYYLRIFERCTASFSVHRS
jgi:hypothetical protein